MIRVGSPSNSRSSNLEILMSSSVLIPGTEFFKSLLKSRQSDFQLDRIRRISM